jgi:hypothetical protein
VTHNILNNRFIVKTIRPVGISIVAAPDLVKRLGMPDSLKTLQAAASSLPISLAINLGFAGKNELPSANCQGHTRPELLLLHWREEHVANCRISPFALIYSAENW